MHFDKSWFHLKTLSGQRQYYFVPPTTDVDPSSHHFDIPLKFNSFFLMNSDFCVFGQREGRLVPLLEAFSKINSCWKHHLFRTCCRCRQNDKWHNLKHQKEKKKDVDHIYCVPFHSLTVQYPVLVSRAMSRKIIKHFLGITTLPPEYIDNVTYNKLYNQFYYSLPLLTALTRSKSSDTVNLLSCTERQQNLGVATQRIDKLSS